MSGLKLTPTLVAILERIRAELEADLEAAVRLTLLILARIPLSH
jgi:hypothetical protein